MIGVVGAIKLATIEAGGVLLLDPLLCFTSDTPIWAHTGKPRLVRELPKKRRRTEFSVPPKLAELMPSAGTACVPRSSRGPQAFENRKTVETVEQ